MKIVKMLIRILIVIMIIIILIIAGLFILAKVSEKAPAVADSYYLKVKTVMPLESKYTNVGEYSVKSIELDSDESNYTKYKVWYPQELENVSMTYPVVVMANGTGVPYRKYEEIFEHLASWGFVVIGNDDMESWNGYSSSKSLEVLLNLNETENSDLFSSIYTASCTHLLLAESLKWTYDVSKINIPYFMVAGTGKVDSETITPLSSLEENMDLLNAGVLAVYARRKDADHGEMLAKADGYMTAWFRYTLMNDNEAKKVFLGDTPELENNSENWTDVKINAY